MSLRTFLDRKSRYLWSRLLTYLDIQLFITLCSWPMLAAWGLPLSPAGILGNLLFTPFLSLFLLISSLVFFCELISLPCGLLIALLEAITSFWQALLSQSTRSWLYLGAHPPVYLTFFLPILACTIMLTRALSQKKRIVLLSSIYLSCGFSVPYYVAQTEKIITLPYATHELTILRSRSNTLLVDPGVLGRTLGAQQLIQYTLIPALIKNGSTHIDILIVSKPSHMTFKALSTLIELFPIDTIYLPVWQGAWYNTGWAAWEEVLRKARQHKTIITLVQEPTLLICGDYTCSLLPSPRRVKKNKVIYHELITSLCKS